MESINIKSIIINFHEEMEVPELISQISNKTDKNIFLVEECGNWILYLN